MEENNSEIDITNYILRILSSNLIVIWSWGFENPKRLQDGLSFKVNGFKLSGEVQIIYNAGIDLFDLSFFDSNKQLQKVIENVYVDQLVDVIDEYVEKVTDYAGAVDKFYNFKYSADDEK